MNSRPKRVDNAMTIYHIEFAKAGLGVSGGETWMVSVIKKLSERGYKNVLFTTDNGKIAYEKLGLIGNQNCEYRIINSYDYEKRAPLIFSYIRRTIQAVRYVRASVIDPNGFIISHSEFFPNTIPFWVLAKRVAPDKRICMMHIVCPKLFRGFENHFKGGFKLPNIRFIHHKLNQALSFLILKRTKAVILTNSKDNEIKLNRICPRNTVVNLVHFAATDIVPPVKKPRKSTDLVWVGRFHKQKGILDFPDIIYEANKTLPGISAVIVGGGNDKVRKKLVKKIQRLGLGSQIELVGFVTGAAKDQLICGARLFAMTSYFESYSIVILEAMKLGTPMVSYDLPCHKPYRSGIDVVPLFNKQLFAEHVTRLLTDQTAYAELEKRMLKKAKDFSWERTVDELLSAIGVARH